MIYVILPRAAIGDLMNGTRNQLPVIDPAPIGAIVAVKVARNRRPTCLLTVTACTPDPEGHTLTVRIQPNEHEPLLLAADSSRGYTHDPRLALTGEPEAIHVGDLEIRWRWRSEKRYTTAQAAKLDAEHQARGLLSTEQRMARARQAATLNHMGDVVRLELRILRNMQAKRRPDSAITAQLERAEKIAYRDAA